MRKGRKHTKAQVQRILTDIRALMQQNVPDNQIRDTLGLELRQYQIFAKKINTENERIWYNLVENEIYTQLLRLKGSFFHTYKTALAMAEDPEYKDRLTALTIKDNAMLFLTEMLLSPPELESNNNKPNDTEAITTTTTKIDYAALAKQQYRQHHP